MAERFASYLRRAASRRHQPAQASSTHSADETVPRLDAGETKNEGIPLLSSSSSSRDRVEIVDPGDMDDGEDGDFLLKDFRQALRNRKSAVQLLRKRARYYVPILSWLPHYDWRKLLLSDLIAGVGVAAMLIPQALAYASLADLPPAYGLYTAFVPLLVYFIFGTSRQLSVGPDALSSLLVGLTIASEEFDDPEISPVVIAPVLAFLVGIILLILGLLRVGFIDTVLSKPLLSGFINAVALFGIPTNHKIHGFRKVGYFFKHLHRMNWITFCTRAYGFVNQGMPLSGVRPPDEIIQDYKLPRTQIADTLGAGSQLFSLVASLFVLFTILFLGPAFYYLPKVVMASIIVVASLGLLSIDELVFLVQVRAWRDLALAALTFLLTIFLGIELGIGISLAISVLIVLKHTSVPSIILLGRVPETTKYRDVALFKEAELQKGFIIVRLDESLYFANISQLQSVLDRLERFGSPHAHPSEKEAAKDVYGVVLHLSNVTDIDASALESLKHNVEDYHSRKIHVAFVKVRDSMQRSIARAGIKHGENMDQLFFGSVHEAVESIKRAHAAAQEAPESDRLDGHHAGNESNDEAENSSHQV